MKPLFKIMFAALPLLLLGSCYNDDDINGRVDKVENRVAALETWQQQMNTDISSLKTIVTASEQKDYVTGVTALSDGSGYQISFEKSGTITIKNGTKGDKGDKGADAVAPVIGTKKDTDGNYYWTIDKGDGKGAQWLTDASGNKIRTTGDDGKNGTNGVTPKVKIAGDPATWWIAADGENFTDTGVKVQGEKGESGTSASSVFDSKSLNNTNDDYVIFILSDGTQVNVPRYKALKIGNSYGVTVVGTGDNVIKFSVPKGNHYTSIIAQLMYEGGSVTSVTSNIPTKSTDTWGIKNVIIPVYDNEGNCTNQPSVTVVIPSTTNGVFCAVLEITLVGADGCKISAAHTLNIEQDIN